VLRFTSSGSVVTAPFTLPAGSYRVAIDAPGVTTGVYVDVRDVATGEYLAQALDLSASIADDFAHLDHSQRAVATGRANTNWTLTITPLRPHSAPPCRWLTEITRKRRMVPLVPSRHAPRRVSVASRNRVSRLDGW